MKENIPGPGKYEEYNKFGNEGPKFSIGKDKRNQNNYIYNNPGPGQYDEKRQFGDGVKKSISNIRPNSSRGDKTPGPGQYEVYDGKNTSKIKFGNAKRDYDPVNREKVKYPGPSQYYSNQETNKTPKISFGKAKRFEKNFVHYVPGPGMYNTNNKLGSEAPKYTLRIKPQILKEQDKTPGPGQYDTENINQIRGKSPMWKIGTTKKDDGYKELERRGIPGPGMYDLKEQKDYAFKFGKAQRKELNDWSAKTPGPGHYRIPCSFRDVPRYISNTGNFEEQFRYI